MAKFFATDVLIADLQDAIPEDYGNPKNHPNPSADQKEEQKFIDWLQKHMMEECDNDQNWFQPEFRQFLEKGLDKLFAEAMKRFP